MGSLFREQPINQMYFTQYHNGRPLSVALTEPYDSNAPDCIISDFTSYHPRRSQSLGRRFQRESYSNNCCI
jgi:hypothetical protein